MKLRSVIPMKVAKYGYIFISVIFCIVGLGIMLLPAPSAAAIGLFFGCAMLTFGIIKIIGYLSRDLFRLAFQYDLQFGILLCILGIITLVRYRDAVAFICIAYGVSMIADCLFKIRIALDARRFGVRQWWLTLIFALLSGIVGVLITIWPSVAIGIAKALLGVSLLAEGLLSLSVAVSMVKIIRHQRPDVIDLDEYEIWEDI